MTGVCALVNPDAISEWLAPFANHDPQIHKLLKIALENVLKNRVENLQPVETLPQDAPEWLRHQWHMATSWYEFAPRKDVKLPGRVHLFANSIEKAITSQAPWLKKTDVRGYPIPLLRIRTMDDAMNVCKDIDCGVEPRTMEINPNHTTVAYEFPDGFKIVQLITNQALDDEGVLMRHCIGDGTYDRPLTLRETEFFSLRDPFGMPHATFNVDVASKEVLQCRGKQNAAPVKKYFPYLRKFFASRDFEIPNNTCAIGIVKHNGEYYDMFDLPNVLDLHSSLSYSHTTRSCILPEDLVVRGDLTIYHVSRKVTLPTRLLVDGNLSIKGCPFVANLPSKAAIGGELRVSYNSGIKEIHGNWQVEGCVDLSLSPHLEKVKFNFINVLNNDYMVVSGGLKLSGCTALRHLPARLIVREMRPDNPLYKNSTMYRGSFFIENCTSLSELPRFLKIDGSFYMNGCHALRRLPEHMEVGGKIHTDFGIFTRVESFYKAFEKFITGCDPTTYADPEDNS